MIIPIFLTDIGLVKKLDCSVAWASGEENIFQLETSAPKAENTHPAQ